MTDYVANSALVASMGAAAVTWVMQLELWLRIGASAVAIVAGAATAWYYIEKAIAARRTRRRK